MEDSVADDVVKAKAIREGHYQELAGFFSAG